MSNPNLNPAPGPTHHVFNLYTSCKNQHKPTQPNIVNIAKLRYLSYTSRKSRKNHPRSSFSECVDPVELEFVRIVLTFVQLHLSVSLQNCFILCNLICNKVWNARTFRHALIFKVIVSRGSQEWTFTICVIPHGRRNRIMALFISNK